MHHRKLPLPVEYRLSGPDTFNLFKWQHRQEDGDSVYKREFNPSQLVDWVEDRYGKRLAKQIGLALQSTPVKLVVVNQPQPA